MTTPHTLGASHSDQQGTGLDQKVQGRGTVGGGGRAVHPCRSACSNPLPPDPGTSATTLHTPALAQPL